MKIQLTLILDANYKFLNTLARYNLEHRRLHKTYQEKVREILNTLEDKLDSLHFKNNMIINELGKVYYICKNHKTIILKEDKKAKVKANELDESYDNNKK